MFIILVWFLPGCCRKMLCWWRHTEAAGLKRKKEKQRIMGLENSQHVYKKLSNKKKNNGRVNGDDLLGFKTIWWKDTEFEVTDYICQTGIWYCWLINATYTTCFVQLSKCFTGFPPLLFNNLLLQFVSVSWAIGGLECRKDLWWASQMSFMTTQSPTRPMPGSNYTFYF